MAVYAEYRFVVMDPGIPRAIRGFHQDEHGDWVAELECGHTQHVRHKPPWIERPWVTTAAGRAAHLGHTLECKHCATVTVAPLHPVMRWLLLGVGWLCVGLGAIGAMLPLLPTTVFLLVAAACFARASQPFYHWLLNLPVFGQHIRDYRAGLGIPLRIKVIALTLLWVTILSSAIFFVPLWPVRLLLLAIAAAVSGYLLYLPTRQSS